MRWGRRFVCPDLFPLKTSHSPTFARTADRELRLLRAYWHNLGANYGGIAFKCSFVGKPEMN